MVHVRQGSAVSPGLVVTKPIVFRPVKGCSDSAVAGGVHHSGSCLPVEASTAATGKALDLLSKPALLNKFGSVFSSGQLFFLLC